MKSLQDIEDLVFRGFLTLKVEINNFYLILKTINENENDLIRHLAHTDRDTLFFILAFSIFLFENENVLISPRIEKINELVTFFKKLKVPLLERFFDAIIELNKRASESINDVERFVFDDLSRIRWHSVKEIPLNSTSYTGIEGTENLGLNLHQQLWYAFNRSDDLLDYTEIGWNLIKPILQVNMKKQDFRRLEASDKRRRKDEKERRQKILKGEVAPTKRDSKVGLYKELKKSLAGEKDEHDIFIEQYEKQLKEQSLKKELMLKKLRKQNANSAITDVFSTQRLATPEELAKTKQVKPIIPKKEVPQGLNRFSSQMADLAPEEAEKIEESLSEEDRFFVSSEVDLASEEEINNQLLKVDPGTPEYRELVEKIKKQNIRKLER